MSHSLLSLLTALDYPSFVLYLLTTLLTVAHLTVEASNPTTSIIIEHVSMISSLDQEDQLYKDDVKTVKQWWTDSRWRYTKRPFAAEDIVAKRGNLKIEYPSNVQAKKLWRIVEERFQVTRSQSTDQGIGADRLVER